MQETNCVLTIAGSDSSGGAGIQADIKTISATGAYAASVITVLTAQNTQGVHSVYPVSAAFVLQQLEAVFSDLDIVAVKLGMLFDCEIIEAVSCMLQRFKPKFIVLDPVMVAKHGCILLEEEAICFLKSKLIPLATLITPNLVEAEKLLQRKILNNVEQAEAASNLGQLFKTNVLIKGGHLLGRQSSDVLYTHNVGCEWFHVDRIDSQNTHGTGCSLSSAIASYLAQGCFLQEAVKRGKQYLTKAIQYGAKLQVGAGFGPVDHFYFLRMKHDDI